MLALLDAQRGTQGETKGEFVVVVDGQHISATAYRGADDTWRLSYGDSEVQVDRLVWSPGDQLARVEWASGALSHFKVAPITGGFRIRYRGADLDVQVLRPHIAALLAYMPVKLPPDMSRFLLCPMPGQVMRIDVAEGDIVEDGQTLAVVEAMKMENVLKAERRARVSKVHVAPGAVLAVDALMLEFEAVP